MKTEFRAPYIKVTVTSVEGDVLEFTNIEFGGDIIQVTTNKTLGNSVAGVFTITMISRRNFLSYYKIAKSSKGTADSAYEVFRPGTLIDIEINGKEVMLGIVDSITRVSTMGGEGKPQRSYTVAGRDLGAFLIDQKIWWDNCIKSASPNQFALASNAYWYGKINAGNPAELIEKIFNIWFYRVVNNQIGGDNTYKFADGSFAYQKMIVMRENQQSIPLLSSKTITDPTTGKNTVVDGEPMGTMQGPGALSMTTYGNYYLMGFDNWNYQGDMFNFLKSFACNPFNELYVETGDCEVALGNMTDGPTFTAPSTMIRSVDINKNIPVPLASLGIQAGLRTQKLAKGKAYLVYRSAPYDDLNFGISPKNTLPSMLKMQDLPQNNIDDSLIVTKTLTVSKNNIPTFYIVFPAGSLVTASQGRYFVTPEYDRKALARYGYNPIEIKLDNFNLLASSFKTGDQVDICSLFQQKLRSWYSVVDKIITGTFTIMGDENIRVGQLLNYNRFEGNIEEEFEEGYYYITGVSHNYAYAHSFSTTLTVDRGVSRKISGDVYKQNPQSRIHIRG